MNTLFLSFTTATNLSNLEISNGLIDRLELKGAGSLAICTLSFFNGDEQSMDEYEKIIFSKTDHPTEYILTPHKSINLSDYAYCTLKIFSGNLHQNDKVLLYYAPAKSI